MAVEGGGVADLMQKAVLAVDLNTNASDCAAAMSRRGVSCCVVTEAGSAVGIVTERDLVAKVLADSLDPKKVLVRDIMSTPLITLGPDASVTEAAGMMTEYKVRRLVVVDSSGSLLGILTAGDLARNLAQKHDYKEPTYNALARAKDGFEGGPYQ